MPAPGNYQWAIASLNGDHPVLHTEDGWPLEGPNPVIAPFESYSLTGGIAKMDDGRILAVVQNVKFSPGGYKWSWAPSGDVMYATARFVTGPGEVGPYATIWDGDDHYPQTYTGDRFGTHTYYWQGMQIGYQQILALGDYAVAAFWQSGDPATGSGATQPHNGWLQRFDMVLLDVSGEVPVVVDTETFCSEGGSSGPAITYNMSEPDIGKVADDVFVLFDNPRVTGNVTEWQITAYRVGPSGFTKGPTLHDGDSVVGGRVYSHGLTGRGGKFMVLLNTSAFGGDGLGGAAYLGTVNLATLAVTRDAIDTWDGLPDPSGYTASRAVMNSEINISHTVALPEPRIGIVGGNFWQDIVEFERIGDTVQLSGRFVGQMKVDAETFPQFYFNVGHSWPVAYDSSGIAHSFLMRLNRNNDHADWWEFFYIYDLFGTLGDPVFTQIKDETWPAVAEYLWVIMDDSFYASMDLVFGDDGTGYLQLHPPGWASEEDLGRGWYDWGHWGMEKNPPWGQYWVISFAIPGIKGRSLDTRRRFW